MIRNLKELYRYALDTAREQGFGLDTLIATIAAGFFVACSFTVEYTTFGSTSYFSDFQPSTFLLYCVLTWLVMLLFILAVRDAQVVFVCLGVTSVFMAAIYGLCIGNDLWPLLGVDFVLYLVFQYIWSKQKETKKRWRAAEKAEAWAWLPEAGEGEQRQSEQGESGQSKRTRGRRIQREREVPSGKKKIQLSAGEIVSLAAVTVAFLVFFIAIGWFASLRYKMYLSPTFDFGIFAQLFEQMAKTGLPYTTLERSAYFSHYGVHFSPALYLLLPGYMIFRSPEYLIYAQAFCVGLGVFPVWLICREFHFSPRTCFLGAMLYLLIPSVGLGCFKDFHENKLLAVLILWLIYFYVKKKYIPMTVFALLTMMVKEDAAIYTACIGLWMFFYASDGRRIKKAEAEVPQETKVKLQNAVAEQPSEKKTKLQKIKSLFTEKRIGMVLFLFSLVYFFIACAIVDSYGEGTMIVRYADYIVSEEDSFVDVIMVCVSHFGYMLQNVFQAEKMEYVLWMLVPVAFLPFRNKKISIWLLFVPMLMVNILSSWVYQYDIAYQYTYGVAALVLTAAFFTLRDWNRAKAEFVILTCAALCVPLFMGTTVSKAIYYNQYWDEESQEESELTTEALEVIPAGASVTATSNITAHLYYIDELYTMPDYYGSLQRTDYYVINYATDYSEYDESPWDIVEEGYELVIKQGKVAIYKRVD